MFDSRTHYLDFWALGRLPSQLILDVLMEDNGCSEVRTIEHNACINTDCRFGRLNVWLDENGQIKRINKG